MTNGPSTIPDDELLLAKKQPRTRTAQIVVVDDMGEAHQVTFTFKAMSSWEWDRLVGQHPPTKDEREAGQTWNAKTMPAALIAKCLVSPTLTLQQVEAMYEDPAWAPGELTQLFNAAWRANFGG